MRITEYNIDDVIRSRFRNTKVFVWNAAEWAALKAFCVRNGYAFTPDNIMGRKHILDERTALSST